MIKVIFGYGIDLLFLFVKYDIKNTNLSYDITIIFILTLRNNVFL